MAVSAIADGGQASWFSKNRACIVNSELRDKIDILIGKWNAKARKPADKTIDLTRQRDTYHCDMKLSTPDKIDHQKLKRVSDANRQKRENERKRAVAASSKPSSSEQQKAGERRRGAPPQRQQQSSGQPFQRRAPQRR